MGNNFNEIENLIIDKFNSIPKSKLIGKGSLTWGNLTKYLKIILTEIGDSYKFQTQAHGLDDRTMTEWLYDLAWLELDIYNHLLSVPLIVESEWNRNAKKIKDDFEKLLVANAQNRLMICAPKTDKISETIKYFRLAVESYRFLNKGSRFLIAIFDDCGSGQFHFFSIIKQ